MRPQSGGVITGDVLLPTVVRAASRAALVSVNGNNIGQPLVIAEATYGTRGGCIGESNVTSAVLEPPSTVGESVSFTTIETPTAEYQTNTTYKSNFNGTMVVENTNKARGYLKRGCLMLLATINLASASPGFQVVRRGEGTMRVEIEESSTGQMGSWAPLICEFVSQAVPDQGAGQIYNWAVLFTTFSVLTYIRVRYAGVFATFASTGQTTPVDFEMNLMSSSTLTLQ